MLLKHLFRSTLKYNLAPLASGFRANVYNIVSCKHHVGVVLHDKYRIAYVAQLLQRLNQLAVVTLVKSDAWLVKDV